MSQNLKIYSLLFIKPNGGGSKPVNLTGKLKAINIYAGCAATLAESCSAIGTRLTVITNSAPELRNALAEVNCGDAHLDILEIDFDRIIPEGTRFYEAHYKLDVLKHFGTGLLGEKVALVDIDAVVLGEQFL